MQKVARRCGEAARASTVRLGEAQNKQDAAFLQHPSGVRLPTQSPTQLLPPPLKFAQRYEVKGKTGLAAQDHYLILPSLYSTC